MRSMLHRFARPLFGLAVILVLVIGFLVGMATQAKLASAQAQTPPPHAQTVVNSYLAILNAGMKSGTCDFSALATIYTPDARVTATGGPFSPGGPFGPGGSFGEQQAHGIAAIEGFYAKLCHIVSQRGVAQWTQDAGFLLSPTVLNSYEHVSISGQSVGRCMHVFTISGTRIASLDWSVYA
jgi:hypothetical protein